MSEPTCASEFAAGPLRPCYERGVTLSPLAVLGLTAFAAATLACVEPPSLGAVWAIHDGEKIGRRERGTPYQAGNEAWDGRRARIFGARNEVVAFQVVVEAGAAGIAGLEVGLSGLRRRGGGDRIDYAPPGPDPTESRGRPIQIFTERTMRVDEPTRADWIFAPGSLADPGVAPGELPVQLVPEDARAGRGGLPIDVPPEQNQVIWVEVYTDRALAAGVYDGEVVLRAGGERRALPVELEVFDFTLPDQNDMDAIIFFDPGQVALYQGHDLSARYHRFAHRHRIELVHQYDERSLHAAMGRFDGRDYTPSQGYAGPGEGVGDRVIPAGLCISRDQQCPAPAFADLDQAAAAADAWVRLLRSTVPSAVTFIGMMDEPRPADYPAIRRFGAALTEGGSRALPIFATTRPVPELEGSVDIWSVQAGQVDVEVAARVQAAGQRYGFYNGQRPQTGTMVIDAPATDPRMIPWAAFAHRMDHYLAWNAVHWRHNDQKQGERVQNVWAEPVTFDNRGQPGYLAADTGFINGDGVLLYPGEERLHPEEDRGIAGPVGTIQLANLRRGLQDRLYLALARERGCEAEVAAALAQVVPAVFSRAGPAPGFAERGDAYERARRRLAEAIVGSGPCRPEGGTP